MFFFGFTNEKVKTSERLNELNLLLSRLAEKLDDEKNIKYSIDELNMNVKNIIENDKINLLIVIL